MAQSKSEIQDLLRQANTEPRHRFGQNFMIDQNVVRLIADTAEIDAVDTILEVGPGTGTLTDELLSRQANVVAVEIDRDLAGLLRNRLAGEPRFRLIEGDALDGKHAIHPELIALIRPLDPARVKLVANLPYNIASPLIVELLIAGVSRLVFTVQKEVADRLAAAADTDDFGPLSVVVQQMARVRVVRTLGPGIFWPPPKIDSALVQVDRKPSAVGDDRAFAKFVQSIFAFRRKTLKRACAQAGVDESAVERAGLDRTKRPETLGVDDWVRLFQSK
jgi:16S rRNA (adenine1518-N6/adenine1519-N6)-dimethyltransferase